MAIYVVGAQCTGKTTLANAVFAELTRLYPKQNIELVQETARSMLEIHKFTRDDVREGTDRCVLLQKLILAEQFKRESGLEPGTILISDRSGIDPLVYTDVYCHSQASSNLSNSKEWAVLRSNLQKAVVFVCEPIYGWLMDDGTRLMPANKEEWNEIHARFCLLLSQYDIPYLFMPADNRDLSERVQLVLNAWKNHQ